MAKNPQTQHHAEVMEKDDELTVAVKQERCSQQDGEKKPAAKKSAWCGHQAGTRPSRLLGKNMCQPINHMIVEEGQQHHQSRKNRMANQPMLDTGSQFDSGCDKNVHANIQSTDNPMHVVTNVGEGVMD